MKKIVIKLAVPLFAISILYVACDKKILDIPYSLPSEESSFKIEADFRSAVIGTYAITTDFYSSIGTTGGGNNFLGEARLLPGDDLTVGDGRAVETFVGLTPSSNRIAPNYASAYIMCGRANTLLQKLAVAPDNLFTTSSKNVYIGEALF